MCVVIDLDVVCLICLQPSKDMRSIFTTDEDDPELQIAQKISILSELKIDCNNHTLPRKICNKCEQDLKAAWRFRKNCQAAVTIFQTIVKLRDAQPQNTDSQEVAEKPIKDEGKTNESLIVEKSTTEADGIVNNEKLDPTLDEQPQTSNCEEFQTLEDVDGNEQNEENTDDESNFIEFYITADGTTDENVPKVYQEISKEVFEAEAQTKVNQKIINFERQQRDTKTTVEKSKKVSPRGRPRKQNVLQKGAKHITVFQTKKKGLIFIDGANSSEDAIQSEVRQVKTRKRKSQSPENKTPKICELCGNSYRFQHALNAHMRRHNNDKPFPCECCDKAFVSNVELRRHMRVHTGQKPYACQYCDRRFSDFGSRIKHERTHTGERPYHCTTCGKSFAYPHVLSVHVLTHTGEKRFRCDYCSKGFTKKKYLLTHISQHHSSSNFKIVIDDTIDNSQSPTNSGKTEECIYTAELLNESIGDVEEYNEDSYQRPGEIIIQPKSEVDNESEEFTIRLQ